jgi:hypothetical protein
MSKYQTQRRNENRGYMKLIVWQKAMELFEPSWRIAFVESNWIARIAEDPSKYLTEQTLQHFNTPTLHYSVTPAHA